MEFVLVGLFLVVVFGLFTWYNRKNRAAMAGLLPGLAQVIQGSVVGEGVQGVFQGMPASARVHGIQVDEESFAKQYFWIAELGGIGLPDFDVTANRKGQLLIQSVDPVFKSRLEYAGLLNYVAQIPAVAQGKGGLFSRNGALQLMVPQKNQGTLPTPAEFAGQLQTLVQLVNVCRQAVAG
jgi:hypothetical protein